MDSPNTLAALYKAINAAYAGLPVTKQATDCGGREAGFAHNDEEAHNGASHPAAHK